MFTVGLSVSRYAFVDRSLLGKEKKKKKKNEEAKKKKKKRRKKKKKRRKIGLKSYSCIRLPLTCIL